MTPEQIKAEELVDRYAPTKVNEVLELHPGDLFIADIIGNGIYKMVENGVNHMGYYYAIVECRKLFLQGLKCVGHKTTCHPIDIEKWNGFKRLTSGKS